MKRLFEYMTAENQTIDGGYLDHLTEAFEAEAAVSSSAAMKNAIVRVLKSETYHRAQRRAAALLRPRSGCQAGQGTALPRRLHPAEELRAMSRHHLRRRCQS
jgi:hypothetical protein